MPELETASTIQCPPPTLFEFLIRPHQAMLLSPPDIKVSVVDAPEVLSQGSVIRFDVEALGMTQGFVHEIIAFEPRTRFVEHQVEGIFKHYVHEHILDAVSDTEVRLVERVTFEPPGGLVGKMMTEKRVRKNLLKSLEHSHGELKRRLEQP